VLGKREGVMSSMVMIKCPGTHQDVATGILIDQLSFKNLEKQRGELNCPACGQVHHWSLDEAWLAEFELPAVMRWPKPQG
jgi:hypothetical protein